MRHEKIRLCERRRIGGRWPITWQEWVDKHPDYKSKEGDKTHPSVMSMDRNGGTALFPVVIGNPSRIEEEPTRWPPSTRPRFQVDRE